MSIVLETSRRVLHRFFKHKTGMLSSADVKNIIRVLYRCVGAEGSEVREIRERQDGRDRRQESRERRQDRRAERERGTTEDTAHHRTLPTYKFDAGEIQEYRVSSSKEDGQMPEYTCDDRTVQNR